MAPLPQGLPQPPQFALSDAVFTHSVPQAIWPEPHWVVVPPPLVGLAQLATSRRQANEAVRRAVRGRVLIDLPRR